MASAQRLFPALAVLLAVCVAAEAVSTPSLSDLLRQRSGLGAKVSTASVQDDYGYEQYGIETKELCLQESEMKTCGWAANCVDDDDAAGVAPTPPLCVTGQFWTSDFSCCQEQHYGYDSPSGLRHSQLWSSSASIGTCDWTVSYVDLRNLDYTPAGGTLTPGSTDITSNIARLGTAWATCYLGPDSDACGGPLCDRMVMSLQGTVYRATTAYSHWGASNTATNTLCQTVNGPVDDANMVLPPGRIGATTPTAPVAGTNIPAARAPINAPVRTASDASLQYNGGQYGHYDHSDTTKTVYYAPATIIMGIVNGMAGQHKEKWDEGVFEYVPYFGPTVQAVVPANNALDPNNPWIRDKTYKMTFYRGAKY